MQRKLNNRSKISNQADEKKEYSLIAPQIEIVIEQSPLIHNPPLPESIWLYSIGSFLSPIDTISISQVSKSHHALFHNKAKSMIIIQSMREKLKQLQNGIVNCSSIYLKNEPPDFKYTDRRSYFLNRAIDLQEEIRTLIETQKELRLNECKAYRDLQDYLSRAYLPAPGYAFCVFFICCAAGLTILLPTATAEYYIPEISPIHGNYTTLGVYTMGLAMFLAGVAMCKTGISQSREREFLRVTAPRILNELNQKCGEFYSLYHPKAPAASEEIENKSTRGVKVMGIELD